MSDSYMRMHDWVSQFPQTEVEDAPATASQMTVGQLGDGAIEADLLLFRGLVAELQRHTGMDEQRATDSIWHNGDWLAAARRAGLIEEP